MKSLTKELYQVMRLPNRATWEQTTFELWKQPMEELHRPLGHRLRETLMLRLEEKL